MAQTIFVIMTDRYENPWDNQMTSALHTAMLDETYTAMRVQALLEGDRRLVVHVTTFQNGVNRHDITIHNGTIYHTYPDGHSDQMAYSQPVLREVLYHLTKLGA